MLKRQLDDLASMSNKYGMNDEFVLAGGGNTSFKNETNLYIKGSGTALATIKAEEFVIMERGALAKMWDKVYSENEAERESEVLVDMMNARAPGMESRRPSVETLLHDIFPQKYVLHVHPALVNGLTCSKNGKDIVGKLFPEAVWVSACKPGYILALECRSAMNDFKKLSGKTADLLFLENHGVFFAANTISEIDSLVAGVMDILKKQIKRFPDHNKIPFDKDLAVSIAPALRMLYGEGKPATVRFIVNPDILRYDPNTKSMTPDHIVYAKAAQLTIPADADYDKIKRLYDEFKNKNGYKPKIVFVESLGMFSCGIDVKEAVTAEAVFLDAIKIVAYTESFGGVSPMPQFLIDFIVHWEVESYRSKVSFSGKTAKRLANKIAVVTGGAQGFGKGIADSMFEEGSYIVVADMNYEGAKTAASEYGASGFAVAANVTDEASVKNMIDETVLTFGGIDILVNNAGIVKAGSLDEMEKSAFDLVTAVNYTGYFLCVKYTSKIMKIQHKFADNYYMDIVEINSKSGLTGSNKNFAYAGSKFGGIGLTQSFALELVEYNIKVNAICPGNFLNGPLWSDPEKGLFIQYLRAGKVPGAKTIDDVRRFYEAKVPLGRGCEIIDVARAIFYIVEQIYETGQAIPVTGGQEMLK